MADFSVRCYGDPRLHDEEEEYDPSIKECGPYRVDKLPGSIGIFEISNGIMKCTLQFHFWSKNIQQIIRFRDSLIDDTHATLNFSPGSNQSASITTKNGMTYFETYGAGGDEPVQVSIEIPNQYCVDAFNTLVL